MKLLSIFNLPKSLVFLVGVGFFLIGGHSPLLAQKNKSNKMGNKLFKSYGYKKAIAEFEKSDQLSLEDMIKLADSYRLNHETESAELWYRKVVHQTSNPIHFLYYAQALQSNKKYDLAKSYFIKYDEMIGEKDIADQRGRLLAAAIDRMAEFEHTDAKVENVKIANSEKLDFSPAFYNNGVVFVTSRTPSSKKESFKDQWIDDNFMSLFYAPLLVKGSLAEPSMFSLNLSSKYHEGPVSFTNTGRRIFFTRNDLTKGKRRENSEGVTKLEIYTSFNTLGKWSEPERLPFNTLEHEEAHPSISIDGQYLFFASDRPGGFGGMDLYVSKNIDGKWMDPVNLGAEINTAGNEVFPYVDNDKTLFFASDGLGGLGGLDIFRVNMAEDNIWTGLKNIGTPFNSSKDDFGYITNFLGTEGYFTSAREGGNGKDDIYRFTKKSDERLMANLCVYDAISNGPIENVEVSILIQKDSLLNITRKTDTYLELADHNVGSNEQIKFKKEDNLTGNAEGANFNYVTNEKGEISVKLERNQDYIIIARKHDYVISKEKFSTRHLERGASIFEHCMPMDNLNCVRLDGTVINKKYGKTVPNAEVIVINLCNGEEVELKSDENGAFELPCLECGCDFKFKASKKYFSPDEQQKLISIEQCKNRNTLILKLALGEDIPEKPPVATVKKTSPPEVIFEGQVLREGAIIEIKNILYDYDKDFIRKDASIELDKVVALMYQYPKMILEFGSHTDARGSKTYNSDLSQRRAEKAVQYISSKGIDVQRIIARGFGEDTPRNRCVDNVNCSEDEHQRNRRTEIRILHLGNRSRIN